MKRHHMHYLLILLLLTSCSYWSTPSLSVRTVYHSPEKLASVHEDTPDPLKPLLGKSYLLIVHWSSPRQNSPTLHCLYHFEDGTLIEETHSLKGSGGDINLQVDRNLLNAHGSINSYKISLIHEGQELATSKHKLWVPPIHVEE